MPSDLALTPTPACSIDDQTAAALQQALAEAQGGRLREACTIAERALASGADAAPINALLGMIRTDLGDHEAAVRHLEIARTARPTDPRIAANLATALMRAGDLERALQVATRDLAFVDSTLQLARIRGFAADQLLDFNAAAEALEYVVARAPHDWESWNNLGNARRGIGDWEGSVEAHKRSVEINSLAAPSRLNYASALRDTGHFQEAEAEFREMARDFPDDAKPLRELHLLLKQQTRDEEAVQALDSAIARDPTNVEFLLGRASHLSLLLKMQESEAAYRGVLSIDPGNSAAYLGIALVHELSNRTESLGALLEEVLAARIDEGTVNFIRAYHHRRLKQFEDGLSSLEKVPPELEPARRLNLLGQLLDGVGRYDEAFDAFSRMNQLFGQDPSMPEERGRNYRRFISDTPKVITSELVNSWRNESQPDTRPAPAFLVGFPRSGTTLLDTILMSHPAVEVLEEEPALRKAQEMLPELDALPVASSDQIRAARDAYFNVAATLTPLAPGKLLVDKNPLTMNALPLVRRLFPEAKIILALRHPCDVILSCFMANFRLNDAMANFLRLDLAADLYAASFAYYEQVQKLMPLPAHPVRYENVVRDRERELQGLFDFLQLDWHAAVLDHQATALKRGRIKTASYAQVVEPIYTRSAGRWQNYRKHLEPVFPILRPWAEKFGYVI